MAAVQEKEVISEHRRGANLRLRATDLRGPLEVRSKSLGRPTGRVGQTLDQKVEVRILPPQPPPRCAGRPCGDRPWQVRRSSSACSDCHTIVIHLYGNHCTRYWIVGLAR